MKKLFSLALIATSVALLSACSPDEDNKVKVAINTGPDEAIWKVVEQVAKDKYHLDVEVVSFNDYVLPNEALNNKDVDANAFQTLPYLEAQSKERGYKFAWSVKPLSSLSPPILTGSKISANCPKGDGDHL
ncbi:D-methionine-binding lipoprotein metQ precursor [Serratia liquefaciens]|nr:D-methionine-binding lipoprotein metQ precursor [Serratia liquefaciens]